MKEPTRLTCRNLSVFRGSRPVVQNLTLDVSGGEALYISGPNGSGKTTLLRGLATLSPTTGDIYWNHQPLGTDIKAHLCYIGHTNPLNPSLTVSETLDQWTDQNQAYVGDLAITPLLPLPVRYLSAGQRRRLTLTCLLNPKRPLWLLDEPTVGLDQQSLKAFDHLISDYISQGGMVILTGHHHPAFPVREMAL